MTPGLAAERAADILAIAEHADNDRAIALVAVADAWTRLHIALAHAPKATEPDPQSVLDLRYNPSQPRIVRAGGADHEVVGYNVDAELLRGIGEVGHITLQVIKIRT